MDLDLRKDLEVDSVDLMEYIIYLEEAYQIDIQTKTLMLWQPWRYGRLRFEETSK